MTSISTTSLQDILDFIDSPDDFDLIIDNDGRESTIKFIDDYGLSCGSNAQFFLAGQEFGATHLIHASSWEDAYSSFIDESPTISEEELPEAYGIPDSDEIKVWREANQHLTMPEWSEAYHIECARILRAWGDAAQAGERDYPELIEGYEIQDNCTNTGIVDLGHYFWQREADLSRMVIRRKEK